MGGVFIILTRGMVEPCCCLILVGHLAHKIFHTGQHGAFKSVKLTYQRVGRVSM